MRAPYDQNPFPGADSDRHDIWEMLVRRDIDAFLAHDWSMVEGDFIAEGFLGIDANRSPNPDDWTLGFPTLEAYRDSWLSQGIDQADFAEPLRPAIFRVTSLNDIEIGGDLALAHKKFHGEVARFEGPPMEMRWQSLYHLRRHEGRWKISGFTGYMANP